MHLSRCVGGLCLTLLEASKETLCGSHNSNWHTRYQFEFKDLLNVWLSTVCNYGWKFAGASLKPLICSYFMKLWTHFVRSITFPKTNLSHLGKRNNINSKLPTGIGICDRSLEHLIGPLIAPPLAVPCHVARKQQNQPDQCLVILETSKSTW